MANIKLDKSSAGQTITAAPGDQLDLQLEENPTTGFRWNVEDDKSGTLTMEHDSFVRASNGAVGSGGAREFQFKVAKPGRTVLRVANRRSWETGKSPDETFEVTIVAK